MRLSFAKLIQSLVFLLASLPFLISHHVRPIPTFYPELSAFFLGLCIIVAVAWRHGLAFGIVILSPLIWLLVVISQSFSALPPPLQDSLGFALFVIWSIFLAAALRRYLVMENAKGVEEAFAFALLVGGVLNALVSLLQVSVYGLPGIFYAFDGSISGNISQRNLLASYLTLSAVSAIHLHAIKRLPSGLMLLALLLIELALSISTARSQLVYTLWIVSSVLVTRRFSGDSVRNLGVLCLVGSLLLWQMLHPWLVSMLPGLADTSLAERFGTQGVFDGIRLSLLSVAWQMFSEHPLLGAGLGSFDQWMFWKPLDTGTTQEFLSNSEHAHNVIAQMTGELGIVALIPLLVILAALYRNSFASSPGAWWRWVGAGVLIFHSLLEYPLWYMHYLGLFAFFIAVSVPGDRWSLGTGKFLHAFVIIGAGAALIGTLVVALDYWRLETYPSKPIPPAHLFKEFNEISSNPLIGQHARSFLAANISPSPSRIPEKLALCQRTIAEYADEAVIRACLPIYDLANRKEDARAFRERLLRNVLTTVPAAR